MKRRPTYERLLQRRHHMPLSPPTKEEQEDAERILAERWKWAQEITEEAERIHEEARS